MDLLVERWKNTVAKSTQKKNNQQNLASVTEEVVEIKKEKQKKKKKQKTDKHSEDQTSAGKSKRRNFTPQKKKGAKQIIFQQFSHKIIELFNSKNSISTEKLNTLNLYLEEFWQLAQDNKKVEKQLQKQPQFQQKQTPSKHQAKIYNDLELKYFESEKEKHHLKGTIQNLRNKYQNVDKEINRLCQIQKLVDSTLKREEQLNKDIDYLRSQLSIAKERQIENQRTFKKQVLVIYNLIESIKSALPSG